MPIKWSKYFEVGCPKCGAGVDEMCKLKKPNRRQRNGLVRDFRYRTHIERIRAYNAT